MNKNCPVSIANINGKAVRLNALFVFVSTILITFTRARWIAPLLCVDFLIKGFGYMKYSPMGAISRTLLKFFKVAPRMINAGPKIFAAKMGFICSLLISIFYAMHYSLALLIGTSVLMLCSFLESFFNLCLGCEIYAFLTRYIQM